MIENPSNSAISTRTVILAKGPLLGAFGISEGTNMTRVVTIDPRRSEPAVRVYEDVSAAHQEFAAELRITKDRGWKIVYDGPPLHG